MTDQQQQEVEEAVQLLQQHVLTVTGADEGDDAAVVDANESQEEEQVVTVSRKRLMELQATLLSNKSEISRLKYKLQQFQNKHNRQMEHVRFLVNNRLRARPDGDGEAVSLASPSSSSKDNKPQGSDKKLREEDPHDSTWKINKNADWREEIKPIGYLRSCFKRKNGTPRQGNLCPDSIASLQITAFQNSEHCLDGIHHFSHVWVLFLFHLNDNVAVKPKIRPPKLNGERIGVMATRSPHRPNPIGLSLVELDRVEHDTLFFKGIDLVDGTPILDVKPYIPFYDYPDTDVRLAPWVEDARGRELNVLFSDKALQDMDSLVGELELYDSVESYRGAITSILTADPRSSYRRAKCGDKAYAFTFDKTDVHVMFTDDTTATITHINRFQSKKEKAAGHLSDLLEEPARHEPRRDEGGTTSG